MRFHPTRRTLTLMLIECLLISTSLCHAIKDKPVLALTAVQAAAMVADGITTARATQPRTITTQVDYACSVNDIPVYCGSYSQPTTYARNEGDPISAFFIGRNPSWDRMVLAGTVEALGFMWLAERLRHSSHWERHIWWIPQVLTAGTHLGLAIRNARLR